MSNPGGSAAGLLICTWRCFVKVRNTANGATEHVENNNPTILTLIKLGLLEIVSNEPGDLVQTPTGFTVRQMEPAAVPQWNVGTVRIADSTFPAITFTVGTTVYERFCGEPGEAHHGFGKRVVPPDVLKAYAKLYKQTKGR
jgi:hypothetical protein